MSDTFRQSFGEKAENKMKPEDQKSTTERVGDYAKGKTDSAASSAQPEDQKSYMQQAGDTLSGNQNENSESLTDKAKNMMGFNESNK